MSLWRSEAQLRGWSSEAAADALPIRVADRQKQSLVCYPGAMQSTGRSIAVPSFDNGKHELTVYELTDDDKGVRPKLVGSIMHSSTIRSAAWQATLVAIGTTAGRINVLDVAADSQQRSSDRLSSSVVATMQVPNVLPLSATRVPPSATTSNTTVSALAFTAGGQLVAACGKTISIFAPETSADESTLPISHLERAKGSLVSCVACDPVEGSIIASGCTNGRVELLDIRLSSLAAAHAGTTLSDALPKVSSLQVECIAFCPAFPSLFAVARSGGMVQLFDTRCLSNPMETIGDAAVGSAAQIAFTPRNPDLLAVGSSTGLVRLWSLRASPAFAVATLVGGSGDSTVSLFGAAFDGHDTFVSVDRSGVVCTACVTPKVLERCVPTARDVLKSIAALKAVEENAVPDAKPSSSSFAAFGGAKVVKRFGTAAAEEKVATAALQMYRRDASAAAETIADFARDAVARGAAEEATLAAELADQLNLKPPLYEDAASMLSVEQFEPSIVALACDIALRRCAQSIPSSLHDYVEHVEAAESIKFGITLSNSAETTIAEMRSELRFVAALVKGNATELAEHVEDLVQAAEKGALDAELVATAVRLLIDDQADDKVTQILRDIADIFAHRTRSECTPGSLAIAAAVFRTSLEPVVLPRPFESTAAWATAHFTTPKAVAVTGSLIALALDFNAQYNREDGELNAEALVEAIKEYDVKCPAIEPSSPAAHFSPLARIPSPTFAGAIVAALNEMGQLEAPRLLKYAVEYHAMVRSICRGPESTLADDEDARTDLLHPDEAVAVIQDYAAESLNVLLDNSDAIDDRLATVASNLSSTSLSARAGATSDFEPVLIATNEWVEAAAGAYFAIKMIPNVDTVGCWSGFDPLGDLDEALARVLNTWVGLLDAAAAAEEKFRTLATEHVDSLVNMATAMCTELDVDPSSPDAGVLGVILEEGNRFTGGGDDHHEDVDGEGDGVDEYDLGTHSDAESHQEHHDTSDGGGGDE